MNDLRHVAVYVVEPDAGCFRWVLHESADGFSVWRVVEVSEQQFGTWSSALEGGIIRLYKLAADERIGPRAAGVDEVAVPVV